MSKKREKKWFCFPGWERLHSNRPVERETFKEDHQQTMGVRGSSDCLRPRPSPALHSSERCSLTCMSGIGARYSSSGSACCGEKELSLRGHAGYGSLLFGSGQAIFSVSCFWGWPLLSYSMGGGLLGFLTLPYCFFASVWHVSHLHLIFGFGVLARICYWLGWGYFRVTSLVIVALYLFLVAVPEADQRRGEDRGRPRRYCGLLPWKSSSSWMSRASESPLRFEAEIPIRKATPPRALTEQWWL